MQQYICQMDTLKNSKLMLLLSVAAGCGNSFFITSWPHQFKADICLSWQQVDRKWVIAGLTSEVSCWLMRRKTCIRFRNKKCRRNLTLNTPPPMQKWRSACQTSCGWCWACSRARQRPTPSASRSPSWRRTSPACPCQRTTRWRSCEASHRRTCDSSSSASEGTKQKQNGRLVVRQIKA